MRPHRFTEAVRQELAGSGHDDVDLARRELAAMIRFAGVLTIRADGVGLEVSSSAGAVARRCFALVHQVVGVRPELFVRAASGVRHEPVYGVRLARASPGVLGELDVLDDAGGLRRAPGEAYVGRVAVAYLRGAFLAAGSVSAPERAAHLEIRAGSVAAAEHLAAVIAGVVGGAAATHHHPRPRVVVKSGERIGEILIAIGATQAFLEWDERRLRRQLRSEANRLANADGANLRRSIEASIAQTAGVRRAVARLGWDGLDDELRRVALARLTNPEASLAELGRLLDPPVGKSAVHRRLRRIEALVDDEEG